MESSEGGCWKIVARSGFGGFELGKQDHVADRRAVGEEHHQAVDADAFARGRRQPVLERAHVVGVVVHRLLVARLLRLHLRGEARRLVKAKEAGDEEAMYYDAD